MIMHKYRLRPISHGPNGANSYIETHRHAVFRAWGIDDHGDLCSWCEVDETMAMVDHYFFVVPTDKVVPSKGTYMATVHHPAGYELHIYKDGIRG